MNIIIALLVFSFIVLIHELGHFLLAKRAGIKVEEFSIGMGPRIFTVKGKETNYSIKLLPLGGSCMMLGEDEDEEKTEGSFNSKGVLDRFLVIFAGPFFNFILAFVISVLIITNVGIDRPYVAEAISGYPASEAGIEAGDEILQLDNKNITIYREIPSIPVCISLNRSYLFRQAHVPHPNSPQAALLLKIIHTYSKSICQRHS